MKPSLSSFCFILLICLCVLTGSAPLWLPQRVEAASLASGSEAASTIESGHAVSESSSGSLVPSNFTEPVVSAQFAVLMDASTGQVLYKKNPSEKAYPASITKIMTLLLALENSNETDILTVTKEAVSKIKSDEANIALQPGEQITMEQALNALMLASANDAANVIAETIGATQAGFAVMMTSRAKEIGAVNTSFTNANGLSEDNHYTTAYDMALITREGLKSSAFTRYLSQITYTMIGTNLQPEARNFLTHHKMLYNTKYRYQYAFAGKTGYTDAAGSTLVTVANKDGHELICVTMKETAVEAYADAKTLFNYGFSQFEPLVYHVSTGAAISLEVLENGKKIGSAAILGLTDQTIWIPSGSGLSEEMIQFGKTDIDIDDTSAPGDSSETGTSVRFQIPGLATPFFEPFITVNVQASITLDPTPTISPSVVSTGGDGKESGIRTTIVTILKYIAGFILALAVLYLFYVIFMMIKVGYLKRLWRKIHKGRKKKTTRGSKSTRSRKENRRKRSRDFIKEGKPGANPKDIHEKPRVRRVGTPKE